MKTARKIVTGTSRYLLDDDKGRGGESNHSADHGSYVLSSSRRYLDVLLTNIRHNQLDRRLSELRSATTRAPRAKDDAEVSEVVRIVLYVGAWF